MVDVLLGALGRAAASQGTMNNLAFGDARFGYYETIGGGAGAGPGFAGASGVHTHMTNTRITDPEVLETRFPVRLVALRAAGAARAARAATAAATGSCASSRFLAPVTRLDPRRARGRRALRPRRAGQPARPAASTSCAAARRARCVEELAGHATVALDAGDELWIETPGGGGYGQPLCGRGRLRGARTTGGEG